jgi:Helix-hairpin-helix motif
MADRINLNIANTKELTQLPGIAKDRAYRIVSHRSRHGYFTHWEELLEVKDFPGHAFDDIKRRASLLPIAGVLREEFGPRRIQRQHREREIKKPKGYSKAIRANRSADRLKRSA